MRAKMKTQTNDNVAHVLCCPNKLSQAVVITILSAGRGRHDQIMVPAPIRSTVPERITRAGRRCCRKLAQKSPDGHGRYSVVYFRAT